MIDAEIKLPPPEVLQATLRKITETLAAELARPTRVAPDWSDLEWRLARAVAAMHGVSPLLAIGLQWDGPPDWQQFLATQQMHVTVRHGRIQHFLSQLDTRARAEALAIVPLKGAALHAAGLYRGGERPMADIDLWADSRDGGRAAQVLESLGFSEHFATWKHRVFAPTVREVHAGMGEHAQNYLKIELHHRIAEILPLRTWDVTDSVIPPQPHPGLNAYPSNTALLIHLLIHAASSMAYRSLRLLHLHDIALVATRMSNRDWHALLECDRHGGGLWWALPPLQLTARYYSTDVPEEVLTALAAHCQWTLRRLVRHQSLSDVSLSYPWIEAFPGIGWSRSVAEMLDCVSGRIWPARELLRVRKIATESQIAVARSDWGRLSQGQRMLRWVLSRQTRVDTLHAVRTALSPAANRA
jgi:Uncharacterised nucleotidyltransferase